MASDDMNSLFQWIIGGLYVVGGTIMGANFMKINKVEDDLASHIQYSQETYANKIDVNAGLNAATKLAENIAITLNTKMDKTQESVQLIAVEQGKQGENLKNVGEKLSDIAVAIKEKANKGSS
jgi:hypothetical protein